MTSYVVTAGTLEGIKLTFCPHLSKDIKWFYQILNAQYAMDIFDSDIDFIFEDGATKTKLKHNAPGLIRTLLIDNIKSRCASVYTEKQQSVKVDKLFSGMTMSYLLKDGTRPDIICASDIARAILTNLKDPVTEATYLLNSCGNNGYKALYSIHLTLHPKLMRYPIDVCYAAPRQEINDSVSLYFCQVRWHRQMLAYILDSATDSDHKYAQDILIANMYYASEIRLQVEREQHCHNKDIQNQYKGALFENNIACIDAIIRRNDTTQGRSEQLVINTMGRLDHQSHTSRLDQHTSRLETLERQVRSITTGIHKNNVGGHSIRGATNNNDDTRLDYLEGIIRQHITYQTRTNNRTNKKFNSLTSNSANNENNNDDYDLEALYIQLNKMNNDTTPTNSSIQQQQQRQQQQQQQQQQRQRQQHLSPSHPSNNNSVNSSTNTYVTNNVISSRSFNEIREADARRRNFLNFFRGVRN